MSESDIVSGVASHWDRMAMERELAEASARLIEQANELAALRAKVERLKGALKLFACECTESSLCKFPHACPNYIARASLGDTHE